MIQRGYRALFLWIAWACAALFIYLGLYADTEVWGFVQNDPSRITWVIIGLFALGLVISFLLTLVVTFESVNADKIDKIARQEGWMGICNEPKKLGVGRFFNSLKSVVESNGEINVEALVDVEFAIYQRVAHALPCGHVYHHTEFAIALSEPRKGCAAHGLCPSAGSFPLVAPEETAQPDEEGSRATDNDPAGATAGDRRERRGSPRGDPVALRRASARWSRARRIEGSLPETRRCPRAPWDEREGRSATRRWPVRRQPDQ